MEACLGAMMRVMVGVMVRTMMVFRGKCRAGKYHQQQSSS
jgi:hypothetical protein